MTRQSLYAYLNHIDRYINRQKRGHNISLIIETAHPRGRAGGYYVGRVRNAALSVHLTTFIGGLGRFDAPTVNSIAKRKKTFFLAY